MRLINAVLSGILACAAAMSAQTDAGDSPSITKIDPPNWFAAMPAPMLLVRGTGLTGASVTLSDPSLHIARTQVSANGHWIFVWLDRTPPAAETIRLSLTTPAGTTQAPYAFHAPRSATGDAPRGFSSSDVMYLIMPDRFANGDPGNDAPAGFGHPADRSAGRAYHGGDLRGIAQHLDYLQSLGVDTVWTTPLYDNSAERSPQTYHGYSATDMYAVDPHFGTLADLQSLVRALHARGMKFVLDTVPNHVGHGHPWVADEPLPDWFHGTAAQHIDAHFDFKSIVNPNGDAAERNAVLNGWFANVLPDMNQSDPLVAQYLTQNAIWWVEMAGLDGLRIDTYPFVPRTFWHDYDAALFALYPALTEVGEALDPDPRVTSFFAGGRANTGADGTVDTGLYTPFDYPMFFALRGVLTHKKPMSTIAGVLAADTLYPHPERLVTFLGNHDQKRFLSEEGASAAELKLGIGLLATLRGMPELYYGDELGMTGGDDPDNRRDFPGGFPGDTQNAFTATGRTSVQQDLFTYTAKIFALRAQMPEVLSGASQTLFADANTLAFVRGSALDRGCLNGATRILVIANGSAQAQNAKLSAAPALAACTHAERLYAAHDLKRKGATVSLHLQPEEIAIYRLR